MNYSFWSRLGGSVLHTRFRTILFLLACGAIYPLAFAPFNLWPLAFISLAPLLFLLNKKTPVNSFVLGWAWGFGCFLVGASWVYVSIHEFGYVPIPGAILLTLLFVAFLALFKGLFTYLSILFIRLTSAKMIVLVAPLIWTVSEYLQSIIFSGFPWLLAGYSQIDSPLVGLASWLGVYGISWFIIALCASLVYWFQSRSKREAGIVFLLLAGIILVFNMANLSDQYSSQPSDSFSQSKKTNSPTQKVDIALVQPNVAQEKKWDRRYYVEIIQTLAQESEGLWGADLVIWPEGAIPAYFHHVDNLIQDLTSIAKNSGSHLIVGIPEYDEKEEVSYVALKAIGDKPQTYHKQVLVPFGEYVPMQDLLRGLIRFLDLPMSDFSVAENQKPMEFEKFSVIPAICYEIVYPSIINQLSKQAKQTGKPQVIVTVSNDAWFGDSLGPYQHMQMARMRAVELGIPLVRSTNDGITAMVDAKGRVLKQLPRYQQNSLRATLSLENIETPYRKWGFSGISLILIISSIFIVAAISKKQSVITRWFAAQ